MSVTCQKSKDYNFANLSEKNGFDICNKTSARRIQDKELRPYQVKKASRIKCYNK